MVRTALSAVVERSIIVEAGGLCWINLLGRADDGRPILIVYGCRLPDPQQINYDDLLK